MYSAGLELIGECRPPGPPFVATAYAPAFARYSRLRDGVAQHLLWFSRCCDTTDGLADVGTCVIMIVFLFQLTQVLSTKVVKIIYHGTFGSSCGWRTAQHHVSPVHLHCAKKYSASNTVSSILLRR